MRECGWPRMAAGAPDSARQLGLEIVALFEHVAHLPDKVGWVYRQIAQRLGDGLDAAFDRACIALAASVDARPDLYDRQPYHNRQHYCEVALTAYFLCLAENVGAHETQTVLLAALMHDFVHDGGLTTTPFTLERASVSGAVPILAAAGVDAGSIARLRVLVLSTDPSHGTAFMCAALRGHRDGCAMPAAPVDAPELEALTRDPALARLARVICEADILPSVGLSFAHSMRLQERLAQEWQRPLTARDKLVFIDAVLACDFLGDRFLPNVRAARRQLIEMVDALAEI